MSESAESTSPRLMTRRRTLLAAIGSAPAVVAVMLARRQPLEQALPLPAQDDEDVPDSVGYHETEHIRKYYRSAGF